MNYSDLIEILLSDDVYNNLKHSEEEIFRLIPELKVCKGFKQNNQWHIYDVYEHILHVVSRVEPNMYLRLSALFHDIGKPLTYTEDNEGVGHFYNHWNKSVEIFRKYQEKFELTREENELIINLIFYHDISIEKLNEEERKQMIHEIGINNISYLFDLKRADLLAQSPEYHYLLSNIDIQEQNLIGNEKVKNIIKNDDL